MQIAKGKAVTIHFSLTGADGQLIDSSLTSDPLVYLHGGGMLVPGLEHGLENRSAGEQFRVVVAPEDGYGARLDSLVYQVARADFGADAKVEVGMRVAAHNEQGEFMMLVTEVAEDVVTVDANHPLAGQALTFDLTVVDVRTATPEELERGEPDAGA